MTIGQLDLPIGQGWPSEINKDTQIGRVLDLLISKPTVTNGDFSALGLSLICRNRVSELRKKGYVIAQRGAYTGQEWSKNEYMLVYSPGEAPRPSIEALLKREGWTIRPEDRKAAA